MLCPKNQKQLFCCTDAREPAFIFLTVTSTVTMKSFSPQKMKICSTVFLHFYEFLMLNTKQDAATHIHKMSSKILWKSMPVLSKHSSVNLSLCSKEKKKTQTSFKQVEDD